MFKAIANFGAEPDTSEMPKNLFLKKRWYSFENVIGVCSDCE